MYNQPTMQLPNGTIVGTRYKSPIDCLWKTITTEGFLALYKGNDPSQFFRLVKNQQDLIAGSTAHFLRIAPHT
jgi:solute carrier family 25 protein 34/35